MVRTQVQLTAEQAAGLKNLANREKTSVAECVRRGVDMLLQSGNVVSREEQIKRAMSIVGKFHSGVNDLGVNHDKYLDEAYDH